MNFEKMKTQGIHVYDFAKVLISSGLLMNPKVTWIVFHGIYDFGYLLKIITAKPLPNEIPGFVHLLNVFFPTIYDLKYYFRLHLHNPLLNSLAQLRDQLQIPTIGDEHQAGPDTYTTIKAYFELEKISNAKFEYRNQIVGIVEPIG